MNEKYMTFTDANDIHSKAVKKFKEIVEYHGGTCTDMGFEFSDEFDEALPYNIGVPIEKRYRPDLGVTLKNGYEFTVEVKSRDYTTKPDVSVEVFSVVEGLKYYNSYIACVHLSLGYTNLIPCYSLMSPKEILIGTKWKEQKEECKKIFPNSKIIDVQRPNGRGNPYMWVSPDHEDSIDAEEFIKKMG